ncbi:hypothetical protein AgCh_021281 [Apium graveolens]
MRGGGFESDESWRKKREDVPKRSNAFGNARPREEDWKKVDEILESLKLKEKEAAGLSDESSFVIRCLDGYEDISHEAETEKIYKADYFDKHRRSVVVMRPGYEYREDRSKTVTVPKEQAAESPENRSTRRRNNKDGRNRRLTGE